jgi:hypothetical protein
VEPKGSAAWEPGGGLQGRITGRLHQASRMTVHRDEHPRVHIKPSSGSTDPRGPAALRQTWAETANSAIPIRTRAGAFGRMSSGE